MEHTILITLCARGGSKGIPGKNIKPVNGKPLIAYSIEQAFVLREKLNAIVELSTDSEEIAAVAGKHGLATPYRRPHELATDYAGKIDVISDLLKYAEETYSLSFDYVIDLDVSAPLRTVGDVLRGMEILRGNDRAANLFSVSKAHKNPYFNMVEKGDDGFYHLSKKGAFKTRQEAPGVFELNASFYIYRKSFFEMAYKGAITDRSLIYNMEHLSFDLDEPVDFEFISWLMENKRLNFDFNY